MVLNFKAIFVNMFAMDNNNNLKINRILAALVDGLIMFIIFWAVFIFPLIDFLKAIKTDTYTPNHLFPLIGFFITGLILDILYLFISSLILKGSTLGMKMFNITYVKYDGTSPKGHDLFFHGVAVVISLTLSFGLSAFVDLCSLLSNKMGKSFHDIFFAMKMVSVYDL